MVDSRTEITSDLIKSALNEYLEKELETADFGMKIDPGSREGENFIGVIYRITYWRNGQPNVKSQLIVKVSPQNQARREQFFSRPSFLREMYLYGKVLPAFREFEESKGIHREEDGFHEYPEFYKLLDEEPIECIFLADLKVSGFQMVDHRTEPITFEHVKLVMKTLGKFHAISLAMKEQQRATFKMLTSELTDILIRENDQHMQEFLNFWPASVIAAITDPADVRIKRKIENLYERKQMEIAAECVNGKTAEPYTVICHGDVWTNNTMFKLDDDGKPIDVRFLDYQLSRYASPACDIVYYLYCCTSKELRDAHYDTFLRTYHESLSTHLAKLNSDPEKLFPYNVLLEHLHKFGKFGLVMASIFLPLMTGEEGSNPNMEELAQGMQAGKKLDAEVFVPNQFKTILNQRLRDVAADMVKYDYI